MPIPRRWCGTSIPRLRVILAALSAAGAADRRGAREEDDLVVGLVLRECLQPFLEMDIAAAVLGCTHYPIFTHAIQETLGDEVTLIDSAQHTALAVARQLDTPAPAAPPAPST